MTGDRPLLGIALTLAVCLSAPLGDALAKLLGAHLSIGQITTLRFLAQGLLLIPLSLALRQSWRMSPQTLLLLVLRTLLHVGAIALVVLSLRRLPLADFIAITYVMPFMALLLGWLFLKETVGPHRLLACVAGFGGTLLVLQPAFAEVGAAALLPVALALAFTLYMLLSRTLGRRLDPVAQQAIAAPIALAVLLPILLIDSAETRWIAATPQQWGQIVAMGAVGTLAHLAMAAALKYAPASTLAPMQYLEIPAAALIGWLIWGDLPGPLATLGIAITIGSGLYIVWREHRLGRVTTPGPLPGPPPVPPAP